MRSWRNGRVTFRSSRSFLDGKKPMLAHRLFISGETGIRTRVTLSSKHAFQACALSHSATSPFLPQRGRGAKIPNFSVRFQTQFVRLS